VSCSQSIRKEKSNFPISILPWLPEVLEYQSWYYGVYLDFLFFNFCTILIVVMRKNIIAHNDYGKHRHFKWNVAVFQLYGSLPRFTIMYKLT